MPLGKFQDDLEKAACLSSGLSPAASEVILCDSDHPLVPPAPAKHIRRPLKVEESSREPSGDKAFSLE